MHWEKVMYLQQNWKYYKQTSLNIAFDVFLYMCTNKNEI